MNNVLTRLVLDDAGEDLIEYACLASAIALAAYAGARLLGSALENWYSYSAGAAQAGSNAAATITF